MLNPPKPKKRDKEPKMIAGHAVNNNEGPTVVLYTDGSYGDSDICVPICMLIFCDNTVGGTTLTL